jgi:hypothetical protein
MWKRIHYWIVAPAATSGYRQKWNWWPFAYACIYTDEHGREIERFPERPHIDDLR